MKKDDWWLDMGRELCYTLGALAVFTVLGSMFIFAIICLLRYLGFNSL
jgi:hypothetical protein